MLLASDLPDDIDALRALIIATDAQCRQADAAQAVLDAEVVRLTGAVAAAQAEVDRLTAAEPAKPQSSRLRQPRA